MASPLLNRNKTNSLTTQIRDAERQVLNRQRKVDFRTDTLMRNIHQLMTAPATLLLASGIGFIIGELTKRQPSVVNATSDKPVAPETSPLRVALNLITSIQSLYSALPIVWMMKTFYPPAPSGQTPEQQVHPAMADSGTSETVT